MRRPRRYSLRAAVSRKAQAAVETGVSAFKLWLWWIVANSAGELFGLGLVAVTAFLLAPHFAGPSSAVAALSFATMMIVLGGFEGVVVGVAQGLVLRTALVGLQLRAWVSATLIGALIAWLLAMIPSAAMHLQGASGRSAPAMSDDLRLAGAALMGTVLGVVLALPQWWVLRRHLSRALWWLPANALAWAAGMPVVFVVAGSMREDAAVLPVIAVILATLAVAGAVVGAIHGSVLVWLVRQGSVSATRHDR